MDSHVAVTAGVEEAVKVPWLAWCGTDSRVCQPCKIHEEDFSCSRD